MIDFRSDTVTQPTKAMREVMANAPLGDDVFGDDPSINALEKQAAAMFGMEAAIFCPSGTMTNQIAIRVHTRPGDEVICDRLAHIYNYEGGGIAANSGASVRLLDGDRGRFTANGVSSAIQPDDPHFPSTRLVAVENTSNKGGGVCWDFSAIEEVAALCDRYDLGLHLDGARLFNALVFKGEDPVTYGSTFDTISICLSKGLGCPVGSLLLGTESFIHSARRVRKVFGGGMRQAGMLAAAGSYALENHVDRLADDHKRARHLEEALSDCPWVKQLTPGETNIVIVSYDEQMNQSELLQKLKENGILTVGFGPGKLRFVTHLDITDEDIESSRRIFHKI